MARHVNMSPGWHIPRSSIFYSIYQRPCSMKVSHPRGCDNNRNQKLSATLTGRGLGGGVVSNVLTLFGTLCNIWHRSAFNYSAVSGSWSLSLKFVNFFGNFGRLISSGRRARWWWRCWVFVQVATRVDTSVNTRWPGTEPGAGAGVRATRNSSSRDLSGRWDKSNKLWCAAARP